MTESSKHDVVLQANKIIALKDLDYEELNYQTDAYSWSILQCVDHMNISMQLYLDQIEPKLNQLRPAKKEYRPTRIAKFFIDSQAPGNDEVIKFKMKTMKKLEPANPSSVSVDCLNQFVRNIDRIQEILDRMIGKDPRSFRVTTALGPLVKLFLGDALRFILAHNERHLVQVAKIKKTMSQDSNRQTSFKKPFV